jgi:Sushi repeat (SCR repeat)
LTTVWKNRPFVTAAKRAELGLGRFRDAVKCQRILPQLNDFINLFFIDGKHPVMNNKEGKYSYHVWFEPSMCAVQLKWATPAHLPRIKFYDGRNWKKLNVNNGHFRNGRELYLKIKMKHLVSKFEEKRNPCLANFDYCRIELYSLPDGCEQPAAPLHGHVTWVEGEATATFTCERGFTLTSNSSLQCICGRWNGSVPSRKLSLIWSIYFKIQFCLGVPHRPQVIHTNPPTVEDTFSTLNPIFNSFIVNKVFRHFLQDTGRPCQYNFRTW